VERVAFLFSFAAVLALLSLGIAKDAEAAGRDATVTASVDRILTNDVANANYGDARRRLKALLEQCKRSPPCADATVAKIDVGIGVIAAQLGQNEDAKAVFLEALKLDPTTPLPPSVASAATKAVFADAQKALPPPPAPAPTTDHKNKDAAELAQAAAVADANGISDSASRRRRPRSRSRTSRGRASSSPPASRRRGGSSTAWARRRRRSRSASSAGTSRSRAPRRPGSKTS